MFTSAATRAGRSLSGLSTGVAVVADRSSLKALDTTKQTTAVLTEDGRAGTFIWRTGDYSTHISADTVDALYIKADAIASSSGAWVRQGQWFFNGISVRWGGAKADGSTPDQTAIQGVLDLVKALQFGHVHFPGSASAYKITSGLTYDISAENSRFGKRLKITGDGSPRTIISMSGVAGTVFTYTGHASQVESHLSIAGIQITGNNTVGSKGIEINVSAFMITDDLVIEAFDINMDCTDVEQSQFSNSNFRWGLRGVRFNAAVSATSANSLNFFNCAISNNSTYGLLFTNPNAVQFIGGSIQYNGTTTGDTDEWGVKFVECGDGYGTVNMIGTAVEGNTGLGDVIADQTTHVAVYNFIGNGFARPNSASYSTNFITLLGTAAMLVTVSGNTFRGYNTYSPDAGRPYFGLTNTNARIFDRGDNLYGSTLEDPPWAGLAAGRHDSGQVWRIGTNRNLRIGTPFTLGSGSMIQTLNDAYGSHTPLEIRMSELLLSAGAVTLGQGQLIFPATANPSADANTIDDYEEGTFTPTVIGTGAAGAGTYSVQVGKYTKVGDRVQGEIEMVWSAHTGTTNMKIAALPFTGGARKSPVALSYSALTFAAALHGYVEASASTIALLTSATGAAEAALPIDTAATLRASFNYSIN